MKLDSVLMGGLSSVPQRIQALERAGYDAAMTAETSSDPFFPLLLAAEHSERIDLMTSIAVAFSRIFNQFSGRSNAEKSIGLLRISSNVAPPVMLFGIRYLTMWRRIPVLPPGKL